MKKVFLVILLLLFFENITYSEEFFSSENNDSHIMIRVGAVNICMLRQEIVNELFNIKGVTKVNVAEFAPEHLVVSIDKSNADRFHLTAQDIRSCLTGLKSFYPKEATQNGDSYLYYFRHKPCEGFAQIPLDSIKFKNSKNNTIFLSSISVIRVKFIEELDEQSRINGRRTILFKIDLRDSADIYKIKSDISALFKEMILENQHQLISFFFVE